MLTHMPAQNTSPPGWVSASFLSGLVHGSDMYVTTAQSFCFSPLLLWRQAFCSSWCRVKGQHRSHLRMSERSRESRQPNVIIRTGSAALQEEKSVCFYIHRDYELKSGGVYSYKAHKQQQFFTKVFFYEMQFKGFIRGRSEQEVKWWRFCSEIKF